MQVPFSATQFVGVFTAYNAAIWPTQIVAYALGFAAVALALKRTRVSGLAVSAILAAFWAFTGVGYHLLSFARINPAARAFALMFVAQAALLLVAGARGKLRFRFDGGTRSRVGLAMAAGAMFVYPVAGYLLGHGFPNGPAFGVTPCPLGIFTFGMLLLADRPPRYLGVIPLLWALVGSTAALTLGIREDLALGLSGLAWAALALPRPRRASAAAPARGNAAANA